jgi:hypothetical protein
LNGKGTMRSQSIMTTQQMTYNQRWHLRKLGCCLQSEYNVVQFQTRSQLLWKLRGKLHILKAWSKTCKRTKSIKQSSTMH